MAIRPEITARKVRRPLGILSSAVVVAVTTGCAGGGSSGPVYIYLEPDGSTQSGPPPNSSGNPPGNNNPPGNQGYDASVPPVSYDSGGGYDTSTPFNQNDAQSGQDSSSPPSSCTGAAACDPLANSGCASGDFCQVTWDQNSMAYADGAGSVACTPSGGGLEYTVGANCPCGPGYTCAPDIGICYKLCDLAKGVNGNPDCSDQVDQDYGMTVCASLSSCFGICDATVMIVE